MHNEETKRPSIALCHPWLGFGGSEAAVMWGIEALRGDYDITLVTASRVDLGKLNAAYGTSVSAGDFHLLRAPALPTMRRPERLAHWRVKRFEQFCRTNTSGFDIPLSTYNPIDFGRPGIHLVGDFSWDNATRTELFGPGRGGKSIRRGYVWLGSRLFGASGRDILDGHDLIAANSTWTAGVLAERFGLRDCPVLYPPVHLAKSDGADPERTPNTFLCLGRIAAEKRIGHLIEILSEVRRRGHPEVRLTILGAIGDDEYGQQIARLANMNSVWISAPGYVSGDEKFRQLAGHEFGIHACVGEAFGIAVAEMAIAGCVPIVPRGSGSAEIVRDDGLRYASKAEAADKICALLRDRRQLGPLRDGLATGSNRFLPGTFMNDLRDIVLRFLRRMKSERAA